MSAPSKEQVMSVIEVTGAKEIEAQRLLAACDNNVETAVALYFEQMGDQSTSDDVVEHAPDMPTLDNAEDEVRAPIAPIREQLIGPEDDNFFAAGPTGGARMARPTQRVKVKVCPLRDFAREGELLEEQLQATAAADADFAGGNVTDMTRRRRGRAAAMVAGAVNAAADRVTSNSSRLEDLYRPPTDITHAGTFQSARMRATEFKRWLLVNVQSDNFDSQLLNRDVWSDKEVRKLVLPQFLLWQVEADSSEGRRFIAFYHCAAQPYVCVIDPRTGEEMWHSPEPKQSNLLPDLKKFLRDHKDFSAELQDDLNGPSTSKRVTSSSSSSNVGASASTIVIDDTDEEGSASNTSPLLSNPKKRSKLMELSEEQQIALAIRNSMRENGNKHTASDQTETPQTSNSRSAASKIIDDDSCGSDFDSIEEFEDADTKGTCERISYEEKLGANKTELTALKLRLFNAAGEDEVIQLRWPSDTPLHTLRLYIDQVHSHIPKRGAYKLICAFPRKTLETADDSRTLKELGLHPSANLHVTLDD